LIDKIRATWADSAYQETSVADLEAAIHDYLDRHNANPKPFVWTKTADDIYLREALQKRTRPRSIGSFV